MSICCIAYESKLSTSNTLHAKTDAESLTDFHMWILIFKCLSLKLCAYMHFLVSFFLRNGASYLFLFWIFIEYMDDKYFIPLYLFLLFYKVLVLPRI